MSTPETHIACGARTGVLSAIPTASVSKHILLLKKTEPNSEMNADLNRNWPKGYGSGSSSNPHSEIYRGAHAFSEPETKALSDYIRTKAFRAHVDFHTYDTHALLPVNDFGLPFGFLLSPCQQVRKGYLEALGVI